MSTFPAGKLCTHYGCRCDRAAALALESVRLGDPGLLKQALAVHDQLVPCTLPTVDAPAAVRRVLE